VTGRHAGRSATRERILDAAFEIFCERGFAGAALTEVERRVGLAVGTGSLYFHFRTKADLFEAVVAREVQQRVAEGDAEMAAAEWPADDHGRMVLDMRLTLSNIRRFEPVVKLIEDNEAQVPGLRDTYGDLLNGTGAVGSWVSDKDRFLVMAALAGYYAFVRANRAAFAEVPEDEFLEELATRLGQRQPTRADSETYRQLIGRLAPPPEVPRKRRNRSA